MAFEVAVAQQKGASGKSTIATNLAVVFAAHGRRVALLDTDPRDSVTHWHAERRRHGGERVAPFFFDLPSGRRVSTTLDKPGREQDVLVLETPPHAGAEVKLAICVFDAVLMLQPSPADLRATEGMRRLAAEERRSLRALLSRVPAQGKMRGRLGPALAERKVALLEQGLGNRAQSGAASLNGLSITEPAPRFTAAAETRALATAVAAFAHGR